MSSMIVLRLVSKNETNSEDFSQIIGRHIPKINGSVSKSISVWVDDWIQTSPNVPIPPYQLYLGNRLSGKGTIRIDDLEQARQVVQNCNIRCFTHGPLTVNLSKPYIKDDPNTENWVLGLVQNDLIHTAKYGGKGVVVHVGKEVKQGVEYALNKMEESIRKILPYATEECPLLLETCAGQGTELCSRIEDFAAFYSRFSEEDHKRFKICIDTCHVFASGYDPLEYIQRWTKYHGSSSIALIHFNDSKKPLGCRVDRHEHYTKGTGCIGISRMLDVARWCYYYNFPMVIE